MSQKSSIPQAASFVSVVLKRDTRDVFAIVALSRATYRKIVQNLLWATGYNIVAVPLAAGVAYPWGIVISPAVGAALMSASTIIVAINAQLLARARKLVPRQSICASPWELCQGPRFAC
jgi:P-type Cu2+ transporter